MLRAATAVVVLAKGKGSNVETKEIVQYIRNSVGWAPLRCAVLDSMDPTFNIFSFYKIL